MRAGLLNAAAVIAAAALCTPAVAAGGEQVKITGEVIDTWCYFSGVMGGPDVVVGSAHHTCAVWCAAGGIPVGVRADDGTVYMVMKLNGAPPLSDVPALLEIQSDRITANGTHYVRDGINYLVVNEVVSDEGIVNLTHEDYGVVPPFAIPKSVTGEK
ncbi:MAG: hypothetical protein KDJ77_16420 [Rhodobiaceae bacterium]|nr:hypothetical protein [Rhodobiaceae bacterium]